MTSRLQDASIDHEVEGAACTRPVEQDDTEQQQQGLPAKARRSESEPPPSTPQLVEEGKNWVSPARKAAEIAAKQRQTQILMRNMPLEGWRAESTYERDFQRTARIPDHLRTVKFGKYLAQTTLRTAPT